MKNLNIILVIILLSVLSCSKEETPNLENCIEKSKNANWITEDFKYNYTIQFPDNYAENGMLIFEGPFFLKQREDNRVKFEYNFCKYNFCYEFGDTLSTPIPSSIVATLRNGKSVSLTSKKKFCFNENLVGILYYDTEQNSTGKYFMKQGTYFLDGLTIFFDKDEYQDVENIIKTIIEN